MIKYRYDAWGNVLDKQVLVYCIVSNHNPFLYKGYVYDEETKWYYLQSRYYIPEIGRFLSPDSVDYADPTTIGGLNLYAYCNNDSINYCDPSGHSALLGAFIILLIGASVGGILGTHLGKDKEKVGWELAKSILLGIFMGMAAAGLVLISISVPMLALGFYTAGKLVAVTGILAFNFFAMVIGPLYGIEVEPLDISTTPGSENSSYGEPGAEYEHPANKKRKKQIRGYRR